MIIHVSVTTMKVWDAGLVLQNWEEAKTHWQKKVDFAEGQLQALRQEQLLEAAKHAEAIRTQVCLIQRRDCTF